MNVKYIVLTALLICFLKTPAISQHNLSWQEVRNCEEINTSADEFAPVWNPNENILFFNSTRTGISRFYIVPVTSEMTFLKTDVVGGFLNSARENRSYMSFSPNAEAYFSAFRQSPRNSVLNIFKSSFKNGEWTLPESVEELQEDDFTAHPAFSPDGKTLVFSSTRSGGEGGTDLWITRREENGKWREPLNLGDKLNSERDEITPFLKSSDTLYFSSNGFGGKGGFEIFTSVLEGGEWQLPIALNEINTASDESDFAVLKSGMALYASNKSGGKGGLDLYLARLAGRNDILLKENSLKDGIELSIMTDVREILIAREFAFAAGVPLIPYIFFDDGSVEISLEMKLSGHNAANFLKGDSSWQPAPDYVNLLNVIGSRMRQYPESKLTIEGWSREKVNSNNAAIISRGRVQSVAEFLKEFWGIREDRFSFGFHELPQNTEQKADDRRVELSSADERLLAPVRTREKLLSVQPEMISVKVDARPRNLIAEWKVFKKKNDLPELIATGKSDELPKSVQLATEALVPADNKQENIALVFQTTDNNGFASEQSAIVKFKYSTVQSATAASRNYTLFLLKTDDAFKNGALDDAIEYMRSAVEPIRIKIKYIAGEGSKMRAERVLKEIRERSFGKEITITLEENNILDNLPKLLLPFSAFAVEISIE
ncbi:MAG: hypothetical protein V4642_03870 [Bacteroidota bacterium]